MTIWRLRDPGRRTEDARGALLDIGAIWECDLHKLTIRLADKSAEFAQESDAIAAGSNDCYTDAIEYWEYASWHLQACETTKLFLPAAREPRQ